MPAHEVTIENSRITKIRTINPEDFNEVGLEWALSELKDSYRHSEVVNASFSLSNDEELQEFLQNVTSVLGPTAAEGVDLL